MREELLVHIAKEAAGVRDAGWRALKVLSDIDDTFLCSGGSFPSGQSPLSITAFRLLQALPMAAFRVVQALAIAAFPWGQPCHRCLSFGAWMRFVWWRLAMAAICFMQPVYVGPI